MVLEDFLCFKSLKCLYWFLVYLTNFKVIKKFEFFRFKVFMSRKDLDQQNIRSGSDLFYFRSPSPLRNGLPATLSYFFPSRRCQFTIGSLQVFVDQELDQFTKYLSSESMTTLSAFNVSTLSISTFSLQQIYIITTLWRLFQILLL